MGLGAKSWRSPGAGTAGESLGVLPGNASLALVLLGDCLETFRAAPLVRGPWDPRVGLRWVFVCSALVLLGGAGGPSGRRLWCEGHGIQGLSCMHSSGIVREGLGVVPGSASRARTDGFEDGPFT